MAIEGRDKLICQSLFSWVNDGSHSIHDDLYINHGEQTNEAYLRVFREVFEKAGQIAAEIPNSFMPQQFKNPANPDVHRRTTALELWEDTDGQIDALIQKGM